LTSRLLRQARYDATTGAMVSERIYDPITGRPALYQVYSGGVLKYSYNYDPVTGVLLTTVTNPKRTETSASDGTITVTYTDAKNRVVKKEYYKKRTDGTRVIIGSEAYYLAVGYLVKNFLLSRISYDFYSSKVMKMEVYSAISTKIVRQDLYGGIGYALSQINTHNPTTGTLVKSFAY